MVLQIGTTAALAAAVVVVTTLVLAVGAVVYWVYRDASARGSERAGLWALVVAAFVPALFVYLARRGAIGERPPESDRERLVRLVAASVLVAWAVVAVVTPPDPLTQVVSAGAAVPLAAVAGYLYATRVAGDGANAAA